MVDIIKQSNTRIKTGVALVLVLMAIGFIDSLQLTWLFLGAIMMLAVYESMELFKVDDNKIFIYALLT